MIIALCGFANSGKSTIATYLVEKYNFTRLSFAASVKDAAAVTFGWDRKKLEGITDEDRAWREAADPYWSAIQGGAFTPRNALQLIGNTMRTVFHPNIWCSKVVKTILDRENALHAPVVIDDMRYCNERDALEAIGATTFIVKTPGFPSTEHQRVWDLGFTGNGIPGSSLHPSEWDWLRHHAIHELSTPVILNDGDLPKLYKTIDSVYTTLLERERRNLSNQYTMKSSEAF